MSDMAIHAAGHQMGAAKGYEKTEEVRHKTQIDAEQAGVKETGAAQSKAEGEDKTPGVQEGRPRYDEYIKGEEDSKEKEDAGIYADPRKEEQDEQKCTCSTDKVDSEIKKLKEQLQQAEQKMAGLDENDSKYKSLEQEKHRLEQELRQKDNDTYRKQHASYTYS